MSVLNRSRSGIPSEARLLLDCARASIDSERAGRIKDLTKDGLDWNLLMGLALPNGMMPLLYWHLNTICAESVPPGVLNTLRNHLQRNGRRNLRLVAELLELLKLFENNGIPAVPYKGGVLAAQLYGNVSLRQFGDLDIIVPKSHALSARDLLLSRGYESDVQLNRWQEKALLDSQCHFHQVRRDRNIEVEIHWEIVPHFMAVSVDLQQVWQRLVRTRFGGTTVLSFSPEDLLFILCVHGTKHGWKRLQWICDVAELVRRHHAEISWRRLMERAETSGCQRMLLVGLFLAHELLESPVPGEVLSKIEADPTIGFLVRQVRRRFVQLRGTPSVFVELFFQIATRERLRDRIKYLSRLGVALNVTDWEVLNLPALLKSFYYVVRPFRLLATHAPVLWRKYHQ